MELQEPDGEDVVLLDTPEAGGLSEAGRDGREGPPARPGDGGAAEERRQDVPFPVPGTGRRRGQPGSSPPREDGSGSLPGVMERSQLVIAEAADPAPNEQAGGDKRGMVSMAQPAGSTQVDDDCIGEGEPDRPEPQASPECPLSPVAGEKWNQSIQKVNDWFSKSQLLSPAPSQDVSAKERDPDLYPYFSDGDSHIFQETELMGDRWEAAAGCGVGGPGPKPAASRMVDKIFGRTYVRTCKSNRIRIPAEESCAAVNTKSHDTPVRRIPAHRKATLELTPEDVTKKQTAVEDSEGAGGSGNAALVDGGPRFAVEDGAPGTVQRPAELPVEEGASGFGLDASPVGCHLCSLQNREKPRKSLSKRSQRSGKPVCPLHLAVPGSCGSPEKAQAGGSPSSEGSREGSSGQRPVRRSKRLRSRAEGEQWESEPAQKRRKPLGAGEKDQKETQAGNASPSGAEGSPSALHGRQMGVAGDASQACALPDGEGSPSVKHPTERYSPCHIVPDATSQGSCLLLQRHLAEGEQSDLQVREFRAVPQAEQSTLCTQAPVGNGFCLQDVKKSCRSPKVPDNAIGSLELKPGTDDSELDAGFMWEIFHGCKRQSFLLHPAPLKKPAAGTQTELSLGQIEGSEANYARKSAPGIASVSQVRREAISSSESKHLQVASQAAFPNSVCMPVPVKEAKSGNLLQSPKPASSKNESSEMEKASNANDCSCGSSGLWRRGNLLQGTSLHPADETNSETTQFLEMRPENNCNKALDCSFCMELIQPPSVACQSWSSKSGSDSVENKSGVGEQQQPRGSREQTVQMSSTGVSEGHLERSPKDETPGFTLLSDTPEGLLGPATKNLLNPWEVDQQDPLAAFAKTDRGSPLEKDAGCSSSTSGSGPESLAQARRRRAQKLSSSKEEDSSEDEELPCFQALLFGRSASTPSQPTKEAAASAEIPTQRSSRPQSRGEDGSPSQESEGSVDLFSSQSLAPEDSTGKPCGTRLLTPAPTSQGKEMTPRTPVESLGKISRDAGQLQDGHRDGISAEPSLGEALGYDSEVSHLGDSSGFSSQSEILTTQQKDAMQNNLKKLQQEMAVLQAALKEGGPDDATEGCPLPGEDSVSAGGQTSSASSK
ncbi:UNVERIFIED_CONTAM: hypothetical protein K2H54_006608 [Gekko kuhli]